MSTTQKPKSLPTRATSEDSFLSLNIVDSETILSAEMAVKLNQKNRRYSFDSLQERSEDKLKSSDIKSGEILRTAKLNEDNRQFNFESLEDNAKNKLKPFVGKPDEIFSTKSITIRRHASQCSELSFELEKLDVTTDKPKVLAYDDRLTTMETFPVETFVAQNRLIKDPFIVNKNGIMLNEMHTVQSMASHQSYNTKSKQYPKRVVLFGIKEIALFLALDLQLASSKAQAPENKHH